MPLNKITTNDFTDQSFFVGLDVHKKSWSVTVRTCGIEVEHFTQTPDPLKLVQHLQGRFKGAEFHSAYEAGFSGTWAHTALCQAGIHNRIIHPGDLPLTDKQKNNKTDLHDSRAIAKYLESDLLKGIYIMSAEQQQRRALFRLRQNIVKDTTRSHCRLKGLINYFGVQLPAIFEEKKYISRNFLAWLKKLQLSTPQGTETLQYYIEELIHQRNRLLLVTRKLRLVIKEQYKQQFVCLLTVPGFGPITTIGLLTETGDLNRFNKAPNEFASYLGVVPAERGSGDKIYSNHIQPRCNRILRPLLIEAAWQAIRQSPALLSYYKKHAGRNNKKAIIKVCRKLVFIAKAVALSQQPYIEPGGNGSH